MTTRSGPRLQRWIIPSAVEKAHGNDASSTSDRRDCTAMASTAAATMNSAKAPSRSDPTVTVSDPLGDWMARTRTRCPTRSGETPSPTATILPQQSAPWIRGNEKAPPDQFPSLPASRVNPALAPEAVSPRTVFEYHPIRVLMSVLLTAEAPTRISTSPRCRGWHGQVVTNFETIKTAVPSKDHAPHGVRRLHHGLPDDQSSLTIHTRT